MDMPQSNRLLKGVPEAIKGNAEMLQEHLSKLDYKLFLRAYFIGLGIFVITLFSIIATIRLAISLF
jgi:hypothetical protein